MLVYLREGSAQAILRAVVEAADQTFYLTQWRYTDTGLTSPSDDPIAPGAWQDSHWSANSEVTGMTRPKKKKKSRRKRDSHTGSSALKTAALITRPTRQFWCEGHRVCCYEL